MTPQHTSGIYENLISSLATYRFLSDYHLTAYCRNNQAEPVALAHLKPCCQDNDPLLCGSACVSCLPRVFEKASSGGRPAVFHCPVGILGFVMELRQDPDLSCFVVGSGVREKSLDVYRIESLAKTEGVNPFALLDRLQELPIVSEQQVKEVADRTYSVALGILGGKAALPPHAVNLERLKIVTALSSSIDQAQTAHDVLVLLQETVGFLFDVPGIASLVPQRGKRLFGLERAWGQPDTESVTVKPEILAKTFPPHDPVRMILRDDMLQELLPGVQARCASCYPLAAEGELFAVIFFLDHEFREEDNLLVEVLTGRAIQRLDRLRLEEETGRREALSNRLLSMISTLAMTEGQQLNDLVLQMAADLVDASCGSLMMLDEERQVLHITAAKGMNPHLLKVMNIKVGSGIAGKVAASGSPLVVNDIEKDERVATANRPRFRTKSFMSLPLMFRGRTRGVLNLADKSNDGIFTEADLNLLTPFVSHISSLMQRNSSLERVEMLERLSITDPLTELYNRRFLERRMEEEINRSMRTDTSLTVMLIDLDYFKTYNDVCGHIAGDRALKKVAGVLRASVRDMDVVTRYGGEEFCILLPGTSKRESIFVAERIRRDIENEIFHGEEHLPFGRLTTSLGISSYPEDGVSSTAIINAADIALYEAKSGGRNRIVIYNSSSQAETAARLSPKFTLLKR